MFNSRQPLFHYSNEVGRQLRLLLLHFCYFQMSSNAYKYCKISHQKIYIYTERTCGCRVRAKVVGDERSDGRMKIVRLVWVSWYHWCRGFEQFQCPYQIASMNSHCFFFFFFFVSPASFFFSPRKVRWGEVYRKARPAMKVTGYTFPFWAWPKPWRLFYLFIFQNISYQIIYFIRYQCFLIFFFFFFHTQ